MTWLSLVAGAPPGPGSSDWDELASTPGAASFLHHLFAELCGIRELPPHQTGERVEPHQERVATGFSGTREIGYRWVEQESLDTSALPCRVEVETYGLPGMELHWHYSLDHAGQAGHAAFRHGTLRARFADPEAQVRFARVWQQVFHTTPGWQAAPAP